MLDGNPEPETLCCYGTRILLVGLRGVDFKSLQPCNSRIHFNIIQLKFLAFFFHMRCLLFPHSY
jgi:hypothetical protein